MGPLALLKHTVVEAVDGFVEKSSTWKLWTALGALAAVDLASVALEWLPLVDDVIIGGLAIKVAGELLRRRKVASPPEVTDHSPESHS